MTEASRVSARILVVIAGLLGAAGVALSAAAAHRGGGTTGIAANFLLFHAPVFLAVGLLEAGKVLRLACLVLLAGLVLFTGDLLMRDFAEMRLFPMAAPVGGVLLIAGWLGIAVSGLLQKQRLKR